MYYDSIFQILNTELFSSEKKYDWSRSQFLTDEDEDKDDDNITLVGWCSKYNIKCLQENMGIVNVKYNEIEEGNNVNENF